MSTIGAFEAKTHLSALLDRVSKGEKIIITRNGVPAAMLAPVETQNQGLAHEEIVAGLRRLRGGVRPGKMSTHEMIQEGRRY